MRRNIFNFALAAAICACGAATLASCSSDDPVTTDTGGESTGGENEGGGTSGGDSTIVTPTSNDRYVVVATVDEAAYMLTASSLDSGTITTVNNGLEVISGAYTVFKDKEYAFILQYNKGGAGTGASYFLNSNGSFQEKYSYILSRFTTYGLYGKYLVTVSAGNSTQTDADGNVAKALLFNYLDGTDGSQTENSAMCENYLGNGEYVTFAGLVEANNRLYTSVIPGGMTKYAIKAWPNLVTSQNLIAANDGGSASSSYEAGTIPTTQYPDSAYVAIYNSEDMTQAPVAIARTGNIGFACGRYRSQYYQTIWPDDEGNIYVFSPGYGRTQTSVDTLQKVTGQLPSGVMRIKAGETDFDPYYYVNLEAIGTQKPMFRCWHITGDYFLLQLYTDGVAGMMQGRSAVVNDYAIYQGSTKTITPVTGLPDSPTISGEPFAADGKAYVGITVTTGDYPAIYKIDVATGVATKGLTVQADGLSGMGILTY